MLPASLCKSWQTLNKWSAKREAETLKIKTDVMTSQRHLYS